MPIFVKLVYKSGANPINTLVLRFLFSAFILLIYIRIKNINLYINKNQMKIILFMSICGYSITSILIFFSYKFIDVGIAGMIIHSYPLIVMILSIIFLKEKFRLKKLLCSMLTFIGIVLMIGVKEKSSVNLIGVILAILAAISYAIYCIEADNKYIKYLNEYVVTFYVICVTTIIGLVTGLLTNSFKKPIGWMGIVLIIFIALFSTVISLIFFIKGVKIIGPINASILSALEPVTSLVLGVIVLGEKLSLNVVLGGLLIIFSMLLLSNDDIKTKD